MENLNAIVDLSHHNKIVDLALAKQAGIAAILHKATEGLTFVDRKFHATIGQAKENGLLVGAYHFGTGADGVAQAEFFLQNVEPDGPPLLALDFEPNPDGPTMTLAEARAFVTHVQQRTGRWPGLYSGDLIKKLLGSNRDPILANCWLWLAEWGPQAVVPPNWSHWTLWQYTNGKAGNPPHEVAGIGPCDRDLFAGDLAALTAFWTP
jgi:lysozyme